MKKKLFYDQSLRIKLILPAMIVMIISLCVNLFLFTRINRTVDNMDQVYATNIRLGELEQLLTEMESNIYQFLNVQNQDAYNIYNENRSKFEKMISEIDDTITSHPARNTERSIKRLSLSYLELSDEAIKAKKEHNAVSYKKNFVEGQKIYAYLLSYINKLDTMRFEANSKNYGAIYQYLKYLEILTTVVLIIVALCLMFLLYAVIGGITKPLVKLSEKAKEVEKGNLDIVLEEPESKDEIGTVTLAFNQMIISINEYIKKIRENMEREIKMKERELTMENLLKDAQLKYYQAQINPHFLFNTLNAGLQLAMMEDAERTYSYIENMASFFRYRLKKNGEESTLRDELELIDSYMYIMNVRYSNEIHLEKKIDERLLDIRFPGMVLQPIIENALRHGLGMVSWEKWIWLTACQDHMEAVICIKDNGIGITKAMISDIQADKKTKKDSNADFGNGVGIGNVRERLKLFFNREDVMSIESDGEGCGTSFIIRVPIEITK